MKIYDDVDKERNRIETSIKKFGHSPDHNFDWLKYCSDEGTPSIAIWEDGSVVWFYVNKSKKEWVILSDPIVSLKVQKNILKELPDYILNHKSTICFLDVRDGVHDFIRSRYPDKYKFDYEIIWPVVDMTLFDPTLPGRHFKEIRNALSKINREHKIEVVPITSPPKKELHDIVDRWTENRVKAGIEELYPNRYHNMIDGDFKGTKSARVMTIDGHLVGFNAGWETPNNSSEWSAAIGIHDYSVKDLGIALLHEDLVWIKNAGYKTCDLEGSEVPALKFKTQFFTEYKTYKTYTFYVKK